MNFAERMGRLGTESAFEVLARARALERQGREIVHLEIGEPDFDTPAHIREAAKRALDAGATHYGPSAGLPELREAIAKHVGETRGVPVVARAGRGDARAPSRSCSSSSSRSIGSRRRGASIPNPGFPIYESVINFVGGVPVPIPLREEIGFGFDLALLEQRVSAKTKLIIINSPQNPTGGVLDRGQLERIAEIARRAPDPGAHRRDLPSVPLRRRVRVDHAHARHEDPVDHARRLLEVLRDDRLAPRLRRDAGRPRRARHPADGELQLLHGLLHPAGRRRRAQGDQTPVARMVAEFKRRRDIVVEGLNRLPGVRCLLAARRVLRLPERHGTGRPSSEVAEPLLQEAGVAVLAGTAFGEYGEGYLRLSYANSEANLRKALERMRPVFEAFAR